FSGRFGWSFLLPRRHGKAYYRFTRDPERTNWMKSDEARPRQVRKNDALRLSEIGRNQAGVMSVSYLFEFLRMCQVESSHIWSQTFPSSSPARGGDDASRRSDRDRQATLL